MTGDVKSHNEIVKASQISFSYKGDFLMKRKVKPYNIEIAYKWSFDWSIVQYLVYNNTAKTFFLLVFCFGKVTKDEITKFEIGGDHRAYKI